MFATRISAVMFFGCIAGGVAVAESDVLLQAVSFAVTGSDANKVIIIDLPQCIFRVKDDTYYFNNMFTDRISFQNLHNQRGSVWTNVDLHGKKKVIEHYSPPVPFTGSELDQEMKKIPGYFNPAGHTSSATDETIRVDTRESERLVKAWQYIFANGCKGITSPF
jgi:hypothetical protein